MATEVTAYMSHDGRVHLSREEAEFSDFSSTVGQDVKDFLKHQQLQDADGQHFRMLCEWELWKFGGFKGWFAHCAIEAEEAEAAKASSKQDSNGHRKRIGVVGLDKQYHLAIEKEFAEVFEITIMSANERERLHLLKNAHKVFVLKTPQCAKQVQTLKAVGQVPITVRNGVTPLRDALVDLYANM